MTPVSKRLAVALGLLGLALIILKGVLFLGGAFYQRDLLSVYGPSMEAFVRAVTEGALPVRDPTSGFGQPLLGNPDAQIPYPPTWLNLIFLPERAYALIALFHYGLAATGAAALCWRLSRSTIGAFFAGAFWLVGGPLQSFLSVWHHLAGAAWMPWVLLAADRLLEETDRRRVVVLGTLFGLQILAGSADMCAITVALVFLLFLCQARVMPLARLLPKFGAALVSLCLAACLGAATWLTVAEISISSLRASLPEHVRTYWSIHPALLAEFIMPLEIGSLSLGREAKDLLFEGREPFVRSLFLGPLVLPLFLAALVSRNIRPQYRLFAGVAVLVALLASLGRHTPVYDFLTTLAPPLRIFRYPSKLVIPISLVTAVLAGAAVSVLKEERERRRARTAALILTALHAGLLFRLSDVLPHLINSPEPLILQLTESHLSGNLLLSLCALLLLGLALAAPRPRALVAAASVGVVITLALHANLNPVMARSVLRFRPESVDAVRTSEPSRLYVEDYLHLPERSRKFLGRDSPFLDMKLDGLSVPLAYVVAVRSALVPPIGGAWGIEYGWDMDLRGLYQGTLREMTTAIFDLDGTPTFLRMLQIGNVSHVIALHTSTFGALRPRKVIEGLPFREPLQVFEVPEPLPRAYAVSGVRVLATADAARVILDPAFSPTEEVTLDAGSSAKPSSSFQSEVRIAERRSDRVTLDAWLNEPGSVVLLEGFLPGWSATIDDVPAPILRANALFVAVATPPGRHRISFIYRPWTAVIGSSLSALTALALLVVLSRARKEAGP